MSKKILILQDGLFNSPDANAKLVWRLSEHLVGLGYDVTMLGKAKEQEHVAEYHGVHLIHEPVDMAIRERKLTERLGRCKWLRYLISWRAIEYRLNKENIDPFVIEMRRWLRKHAGEYDALIACCSPYYPILLASEVANRIPVLYYKIDPMGSWSEKSSRDAKLSTVENEVKWDSVAMKIMMPDVVYKDYMRLETKVNGHKVVVVQFPNVRPLSVISSQQSVISSQLSVNRKQCNLLFVGKFYADIRHPQYLFDLMDKLEGTGIVLHIVGPINYMGFDKEYIEKYFTNKIENIRFHGAVPPAEADALLTQADVLVHVGNSVDTAMPSKILDYISSGKPILNICKIRTCPTIPLMERYPLGFTILEPSVVSSQLSAISGQESVISDQLAEQVKEFCLTNKGKRVPYEEIERLYPECTIEYVGKQFDEAIQEAIKEFKQK
jgi:glycosyltransferase involved in cell wall biosynthesis